MNKTVEIEQFKLLPGALQASCRVHEVYELRRLSADQREHTVRFRTTSEDLWGKTNGDWKLKRSRVLKQSLVPEPPAKASN